MYKDYLITVFSYSEKDKLKFRVYAKNLINQTLINPVIDKKFLVADSYKEALQLIKKEINKVIKNENRNLTNKN
jgi:hypothetical protein